MGFLGGSGERKAACPHWWPHHTQVPALGLRKGPLFLSLEVTLRSLDCGTPGQTQPPHLMTGPGRCPLLRSPSHCFLSQSSEGAEPAAPAPAQVPSTDIRPPGQMPLPASSGLDDLDLLGKTLLQQSLPPEAQQVRW